MCERVCMRVCLCEQVVACVGDEGGGGDTYSRDFQHSCCRFYLLFRPVTISCYQINQM